MLFISDLSDQLRLCTDKAFILVWIYQKLFFSKFTRGDPVEYFDLNNEHPLNGQFTGQGTRYNITELSDIVPDIMILWSNNRKEDIPLRTYSVTDLKTKHKITANWQNNW